LRVRVFRAQGLEECSQQSAYVVAEDFSGIEILCDSKTESFCDYNLGLKLGAGSSRVSYKLNIFARRGATIAF
jgi:hypothetical protein